MDSVVPQEDVTFLRRWAVVQRIGRVVIGLFLLAAVAGVFGTGPLAHATATAPGGAVTVDYDRFLRTTQASSLQLSTQSAGSGGGNIELASSYVSSIDLTDVSPQPDSETARGDRLVLSYQDRVPDQVQIAVFPQKIGVHRAQLWVAGRTVTFHQVVYP